MLRVRFGYYEDSILDIDLYFNNVYENGWFADPLVKEMIKGVDRHAMSKKGPKTKKAEKSRENTEKAQFYVEFHAKPGEKMQKIA